MKVPIAWLREFLELSQDPNAIAERLASIGFPVAAIEKRPALSGVVVGKIVALEKHPNADRLQIGTVDVGGSTLSIATAATNVATGQIIPVATIGAQLTSVKIERRKMRGFESEGMMCSADELGLPTEWFEDGILQLDEGTPLGQDVVALFGLSEDVLDVEITSNRVDAMSILGLARELSAATGTQLSLPAELTAPQLRVSSPGVRADDDLEGVRVTIESPDCSRFVVQRFTGVRVRTAPMWMRVRLALAGQRPINNLVDISNYVMLEVGQPLHFYDLAKIAGRHLVARDARDGEELTTLDDAHFALTPQALVIADEERAQGLAGIKGGKFSEVTAQTREIALEAANFSGPRVRRTSASLGLRTEASTRHEKTLPAVFTDMGAARAAALLVAEGATAYAPRPFGHAVERPAAVDFPIRDVARLLGFTLTADEISKHLRALGFEVTAPSPERLTVTPPLWRPDVAIAADVVEEIARMAGYDNVPTELPAIAPHEIPSRAYHLERDIARTLAALGYAEIVSYSLNGGETFERLARAGLDPSAPPVEIRNPLSEDQRYLRHALGPRFLEYFARTDRPAKIFEIGHVFAKRDHIEETPMAGFAFAVETKSGPSWRDDAFLRIKGDAESVIHALTGRETEAVPDRRATLHPGKTAALLVDGKEVAFVGAIDPRLLHEFGVRLPVYVASMYLERIPEFRTPRFRVPSRFPSTDRDIAVIVSRDASAKAVQDVVARAAGDVCKEVRVFDEYRGPQVGEGRKSLTLHLALQMDDRTITDADADAVVDRVLAALESDLGATLRS